MKGISLPIHYFGMGITRNSIDTCVFLLWYISDCIKPIQLGFKSHKSNRNPKEHSHYVVYFQQCALLFFLSFWLAKERGERSSRLHLKASVKCVYCAYIRRRRQGMTNIHHASGNIKLITAEMARRINGNKQTKNIQILFSK